VSDQLIAQIFIRDKETKNTVRYKEQPEKGKSPAVGTIYLQKWFAGDRDEIEVTIK